METRAVGKNGNIIVLVHPAAVLMRRQDWADLRIHEIFDRGERMKEPSKHLSSCQGNEGPNAQSSEG
jgi:hypothetical protein